MLVPKSKQGQVVDIVQNIGSTDYINSNGEIQHNEEQVAVMVRNESDLSNLTAYAPGTIAYTAGFSAIWQKGYDGNWTGV